MPDDVSRALVIGDFQEPNGAVVDMIPSRYSPPYEGGPARSARVVARAQTSLASDHPSCTSRCSIPSFVRRGVVAPSHLSHALNASAAALIVSSMSAFVWAAEMNAASNCEGGR